MKITFTAIAILFLSVLSIGQTPELIKNINPATFQDAIYDNLERAFVKHNDRVYFAADDGASGIELWVTDGTEAGTIMLKDIHAGPNDSECQLFSVAGDYVLFVATDAEHGRELWRTDGTAAGTQLVKDINVGTANGVWFDDGFNFRDIVWNDVLYFGANDGSTGVELWRSDGTEAGTYLIKDTNIGSGNNLPFYFAEHDGKLYFNGSFSLWTTDGTEAGTVMVSAIGPEAPVSCNGYLFYASEGTFNNRELWRSDGTDSGTILVKEINTASSNGSSILCGFPDDVKLTCMNDIVYFIANDGSTGRELWRSDGTGGGTFKVKDASTSELGDCSKNSAVMNDVFYYSFKDNDHGMELWRTDGTASGTFMLKDIVEGTGGSMMFVGQEHMIVVGDRLFFAAGVDFLLDLELWVTDGTESGTELVANLHATDGSSPQNFSVLGDNLIFAAEGDNGIGFEMWRMSLLPSSTDDLDAKEAGMRPIPTVASSHFKIQSDDLTGIGYTQFDIELISLSGNIVKTWHHSDLGEALDVSDISEGMYFVYIRNEKRFVTEKLIVDR